MSTNFWVSPADKTVVVAMVQIIPYTQGRQEGGGEGGRGRGREGVGVDFRFGFLFLLRPSLIRSWSVVLIQWC
jgi:hypothetical protein